MQDKMITWTKYNRFRNEYNVQREIIKEREYKFVRLKYTCYTYNHYAERLFV